jgi:hypothetical protein
MVLHSDAYDFATAPLAGAVKALDQHGVGSKQFHESSRQHNNLVLRLF